MYFLVSHERSMYRNDHSLIFLYDLIEVQGVVMVFCTNCPPLISSLIYSFDNNWK